MKWKYLQRQRSQVIRQGLLFRHMVTLKRMPVRLVPLPMTLDFSHVRHAEAMQDPYGAEDIITPPPSIRRADSIPDFFDPNFDAEADWLGACIMVDFSLDQS